MKKLFAALLALIIMLSLCACGGNENAPSVTTDGVTETTAAGTDAEPGEDDMLAVIKQAYGYAYNLVAAVTDGSVAGPTSVSCDNGVSYEVAYVDGSTNTFDDNRAVYATLDGKGNYLINMNNSIGESKVCFKDGEMFSNMMAAVKGPATRETANEVLRGLTANNFAMLPPSLLSALAPDGNYKNAFDTFEVGTEEGKYVLFIKGIKNLPSVPMEDAPAPFNEYALGMLLKDTVSVKLVATPDCDLVSVTLSYESDYSEETRRYEENVQTEICRTHRSISFGLDAPEIVMPTDEAEQVNEIVSTDVLGGWGGGPDPLPETLSEFAELLNAIRNDTEGFYFGTAWEGVLYFRYEFGPDALSFEFRDADSGASTEVLLEKPTDFICDCELVEGEPYTVTFEVIEYFDDNGAFSSAVLLISDVFR